MEFLRKLYSIFVIIISYIFPPKCLSCSEVTLGAAEFCSNCWYKFEFIVKPYCSLCGQKLEISVLENMLCSGCFEHRPNYDLSRSLMKFDQQSKRLIHAFKYQDKTMIAKTIAKLFLLQYGAQIVNIDIIVPVPMNRFKRLFRRYNPAAVLALEIAKITNKPVKQDVLIKSKWTKSQTSLSKSEREKNIETSVIFNKNCDIMGRKILLVDDVITTKTTITKCTSLLKNAGAESVYVMSIAMT